MKFMGSPLEDFVLVQGTSSDRLPLLHATRVWRRQVPVRCFFALNDSSLVATLNADPIARQLNEHYAYYPDREDLHFHNPGTQRLALAAVLAHRFFGESYKWMLYGDDDTQFFLTGAQRLVAHFDPDQPLALSDHFWYKAYRSHPQAPRCLPCGFNTSLLNSSEAGAYIPRPACPFCTRDFTCAHYDDTQICSDRHDAVLRQAYSPRLFGHSHVEEAQAGGVNETARREDVRRFNLNYVNWYRASRDEALDSFHQPGTFAAAVLGKAWLSATAPFPFCVRHDARVHVNDTERQGADCNFAVVHGGAGAVLSVGMMLALDLDAAERFIGNTPGESDNLVSKALNLQGFGFTDAGQRIHIPGVQRQHYHLFDGRNPFELSMLTSERAFLECQWGPANNVPALDVSPHERMWLLERMVAMHASVRVYKQVEDAMTAIAQRVETHRALLALAVSLKEDPRVTSRNMTLWEAMREVVCARPQPSPEPHPLRQT